MAVKVSVVVPTYNSGPHIELLVESLLAQSLPAEEFEVLFVDDGSTDDTPRRLAALTAEHPHFRMIRIPNSGWPGKPRNVGVEQARGAYVQFADHDDRLSPQALERLCAMAERNGSDIVIGKVASNFRSRGVPYGLMSRTRESCTVWNAPLIDSLTPHKLFRTAFLREHGIAHPEGPWILEDQLFMVRAYLKASVVSVLGDYVCYSYWVREDEENFGARVMDPRVYYRNLREVMRTVRDGVDPGPQRDRLLRRFFRVEMLHRLGVPPRGVLIDPAFSDDPFDVVRELALEFGDDAIRDGLAAAQRVRARLLWDDDREALAEFTRRQRDLKTRTTVERASWHRDRFKVAFTARFEERPGGPGTLLARRGDRCFLTPAFTDGLLPEPVDVTDELKSFRAEVLLRHSETAHVWIAPLRSTVTWDEDPADSAAGDPADAMTPIRPTLHGVVAIDPLRGAGGGPLDEGVWQVQVRLLGFGMDRYAQLGDATVRADAADGFAPAGFLGFAEPRTVPGREVRLGVAEGGLAVAVRAADVLPAPGGPLVSVVLAAADDGPLDPGALAETVASVAGQSLPADRIELLVVGDAPADPRYRLLPPGSDGGDPRNVGIEAATGEYLLFMRPGDRLAPEALTRLHGYGMRHDADIVAGKLAGRRGAPRELFAKDRPDASLAQDPLMDSLTANKLFAGALLAEHGIRFPAGRLPPDEQAFTVRAYFQAAGVAVLGGEVCYHYGPAASAPPVPPAAYFAALGSALRTADRYSEPGPARDRLHRRWLRVEMLDRVSGKRLLDLDEDARDELFHALRPLLLDQISPSAVAGLPAPRRVAAGLIADDRPADLLALAAWEHSLGCRPRLDAVSWSADGTLRIAFTATLHAGGDPVGTTAAPGAESGRIIVSTALSETLRERFAAQRLTGGAAPEKAAATLVLRERAGGAEYPLPTASEVLTGDDGALTVAGTAVLDPAAAAGGPLRDGAWDLSVRLTALGWTKTGRLGASRAASVPDELRAVPHPAAPGRVVTPYWTKPHRDLSLRVAASEPPAPPERPAPRAKPGLARRAARFLRRG